MNADLWHKVTARWTPDPSLMPVRARPPGSCVPATARLGLRELDQARHLGAKAAAQAAEVRSVRATEHVRDFGRRLEPRTPRPSGATGRRPRR